jgi:hypothetical protein
LAESNAQVYGDHQIYRHKGDKIIDVSWGKLGTSNGYYEYWLEDSGSSLSIKSYYVGGNQQIEHLETIGEIRKSD